MTRIECPYCKAYCTKIPGPTLSFPIWEKLVVDVRKAGIWNQPNDSPMKQLEAELTIRQELEELIEDGERYEMGGPFVSVHWVLNRMDALKEGG